MARGRKPKPAEPPLPAWLKAQAAPVGVPPDFAARVAEAEPPRNCSPMLLVTTALSYMMQFADVAPRFRHSLARCKQNKKNKNKNNTNSTNSINNTHNTNNTNNTNNANSTNNTNNTIILIILVIVVKIDINSNKNNNNTDNHNNTNNANNNDNANNNKTEKSVFF